MKIKLTLTFILLVIANLIVAQTSDKTEGCAPLTVNFTAPAGHPTWFWDFKDIATSTQQNPANTFIKAGTYVVEFKETAGGPVLGTVTIKVYTKPTFSFTSTTASPIKGCMPLPVSFTASGVAPTGVTINSYSWVYGDGNGGTGTTVNPNYTIAGIFDVSLKINTSSATCDTTKVYPKFVTTSVPPVASFVTNPNPPIACDPPLTVSFNNTSTSALPLTYSWDNAPYDTVRNIPSKTYSVAGNFPVTLSVKDTNNCIRTTTQNVVIGKPKASFSMPDTVCMAKPITIINTSPTGFSGSYLWTFDAGASLLTSTNFQPFIAYSTPGLHQVILKSTSPSGLCSDSDTAFIFVENPTVTITSTPTYSCSEPRAIQFTATTTSTVASWQWLFGDKKISSAASPTSHTFLIPDSIYTKRGTTVFTNSLVITTASGCIAAATTKDTFHLVWARFQPDTAHAHGCAPLTVTFSDSSKSNIPMEPVNQWDYDFGDGTPHGTTKNPTHTFTTPGKYKVVLIATNMNGCKDTSYAITITVGSQKAIDFIADNLNPCPGDPVTFTHTTTDTAGITGWNYQSNGEFLSHCFADENPTLVFNDSTGPQSITLTADYNGCLTTKTKTNYINVKGPIAHFDYSVTCTSSTDGVQFKDQSGDATSLSWDFGDASPPATTTGTFTYTYAATGDYKVTLTALNAGSGCAASIDTATVHVKNIKAKFDSDSVLCIGANYKFDATLSTDVYGNCFSGYSWIFSDTLLRPYTTSDPISWIAIDSSGNQSIGLVVKDINGCADTAYHWLKVYNTPARYSLSDSIICIPDTLQFTDLSIQDTTIVKWAWTFGDGGIDSIQNPKHIYSVVPVNTNTLVTSLTIKDVLNCISSSTFTINIYKVSSAITTVPSTPNICLGSPITFTGQDFVSQGSSLSYKWDFKEGPKVKGNNPSHTYAVPGTYNVKLDYTEKASGCHDSTFKTVTVQGYPNAGFKTDADNLTALCNPQIVNFTDTSGADGYSLPGMTRVWDFGNGSGAITNATPSFTFSKGTHSVKLTETTTNGCVDSVRKSFFVVGPEGDFDFDPDNICKGDTIHFNVKDTVDVGSYLWDFGDGFSKRDVSPIDHQYNYIPPGPPAGQGVAKLILYGIGGVCPVSVSKPISIRYVKAAFNRNSTPDNDTALCLGVPLTILDTSKLADVYSWTFGDGTTSTLSDAVFTHQYASIGTYNITLAVQNTTYGCMDTVTKKVIINPLPQVSVLGDTVCKDDTVNLSVTNYKPAYNYSWTPSSGLSNSSIYNPTFVASTTSNTLDYVVTATIPKTGCFRKDTSTIRVIQPLVGINKGDTIVLGDIVVLPIDNQNGLVNFVWTPETKPPYGLSCLTCSNPFVQPLEDVTYNVLMTDILGCSSAEGIFLIHLHPATFIKIPTTFTPNGDGINDIIYVEGWGLKELKTFEIYNRWGELVFKTKDMSEGWNGYYKGMLQNNEIYVYKVIAKTFRDEEIVKEGHINLMR